MTGGEKNQVKRQVILLFLFLLCMAGIFFFFPDKFLPSLKASWTSLVQFLLILPAIILLIGIFSVAVSSDMVKKNFGRDTGFAGMLKALFFGSLMSTGPFYMSFPVAKNLLEKGAKLSAVMIFVSAWDGIAIVAEIVEFHFMGPVFMAARFLLTAVGILILGYIASGIFLLNKKK